MYSMSGNCLMCRVRVRAHRSAQYNTELVTNMRDFRGCFTVFIGKAAANKQRYKDNKPLGRIFVQAGNSAYCRSSAQPADPPY